jgi:hypothetical protein
VHTALKDGNGGLAWAGLPVLVEWLGIDDVAGLLHRLVLMKSYRKPHERQDERQDEPAGDTHTHARGPAAA